MPVIKGNANNNVLVGTSDDDDIYGYEGDDVLIGSGGKDKLDGGTGNDTMDGGKGDDTYYVDSYADQVVEHAGNGTDTIRASIGYSLGWIDNVENLVLTGAANIDGTGNELDNDITGNSGDNDLYGLGGDDVLKGGGGNDYLYGGTGDDLMLGGAGDDFFAVDSADDEVTEYSGGGNDTIASSVTYTLGDNQENLILTGTSQIYGYGNALDNVLTGNSANNFLFGGGGADVMRGGAGHDQYNVDQAGDQVIEYADQGTDTVVTAINYYVLGANLENLILTGSANLTGHGNSLDNWIDGNEGDNVLYGYGGNDDIWGSGGTDTMYGGEDDDAYAVDQTNDVVIEYAGEGTDSIYVWGDAYYTLPDNVENLYLDSMGYGSGAGNAMDNIIQGSIHGNTIDGGLGQDTMVGLGGDDTFYVDITADQVIEFDDDGNDVVFSTANYTLGDHIETLSLDVGNAVFGTGNAQSNTIFGNAGNNVLNGGGGSDQLSGLGGNDTFVFQAGQAAGDTVYEFAGNGTAAGDVLQFQGYGTAAQGATFTQLTATDWLITSANGLIQETITLAGAPTIDASDFVFV